MPFTQDISHVPDGMRKQDFLLRPIRVSDAELDYEAVMESRAFLRVWEQSSWPEEGFTVAQNRADLRKLEQRHTARDSFAYTVMNPAETQCFGCVYLFPTNAAMFTRSKISAIDSARWPDDAAGVYFWIRKSRLADALDRRLLDALSPWLDHDWRLDHHLFITNEQLRQQVAMFEDAGLQRRFRIDDPKADGDFLAYGRG